MSEAHEDEAGSDSLPASPPDPDQVVRKSFQDYIRNHWKRHIVCPICTHDTWTILDPVDLPQRYQTGKVITAVPVQCDTCKYLLFFNGVAAGLFNPDGQPRDIPPTSQAAPDVE